MQANRSAQQFVFVFMFLSTATAQTTINVSTGIQFLDVMRGLSGDLNVTVQLSGHAVVNVTGYPLGPQRGDGFAESGLVSIQAPPPPAERAVLHLGYLKDVSVRKGGGLIFLQLGTCNWVPQRPRLSRLQAQGARADGAFVVQLSLAAEASREVASAGVSGSSQLQQQHGQHALHGSSVRRPAQHGPGNSPSQLVLTFSSCSTEVSQTRMRPPLFLPPLDNPLTLACSSSSSCLSPQPAMNGTSMLEFKNVVMAGRCIG